ncbi:MAG TPA: hypothetical protein VN911_06035 [Candidatus Acidoferrum sp.]|nr:hypothetical protein [Candidatus Acidoferrum sp.]
MRSTHSMVISMRLPAESGNRLKRMANRHGWTPSDASARLVREGLRRSEFALHGRQGLLLLVCTIPQRA